MVLWTPPQTKEGMRYSILYDFNTSKANDMYEKYLAEIVTPKIPLNGTVIIQGHTDVIGGEENNKELSIARANDVKGIIEKSLAKAGRSDVKYQVSGFGEDEKSAPFENKFPEERFYNRTVIIDIIPVK
jgi:outer membrane protein OmpA-like peptidoglycan-associated protein